MMFIRVLEAGVWRTAPIGPNADSEKTLVMARVVGLWSVNRRGVEVFPGLILSFVEPEDAQFFKSADVAALPFVEKGEIVAFDNDDDANYYCNQGLAEPLGEQEAKTMLDAALAALAEKRDEMLKVRMAKPKLEHGPVVPMTMAPAKNVAAAPAPKSATSKTVKK